MLSFFTFAFHLITLFACASTFGGTTSILDFGFAILD